MIKHRNIIYGFLFINIAVVVFSLGSAHGATITVIPGQSIQESIDKANPGDIILVESGIYRENVNITKPLTLRGANTSNGPRVVDGLSRGSTITLSADGIKLERFVVTNSSGSKGSSGIKVKSNNNTIIGNNVSDNGRSGIWLSNSSLNIIADNVVTGSCRSRHMP